MKSLNLLLAFLLLGIVGCSETALVDPDIDSEGGASILALPAAKQGAQRVHYRAKATFTGSILGPTDDCGGLIAVSMEGVAWSAHYGRGTIVQTHCTDPLTGNATNGIVTHTAANGDQVIWGYISIATSPTSSYIETWIQEGTGRFQGAYTVEPVTGSATAEFHDPLNFAGDYYLEGTIYLANPVNK